MSDDITTFFNEISVCYKSNLPFVVFRKPNETGIKAFVQNSKKVHYFDSFDVQGFVFVPFNKNGKKIIFPLKECKIITAKTSTNEVFKTVADNLNYKDVTDKNSRESHIQLVKKGLNFLKNEKVKKVVLSRKEIIECTDFDILNSLKKMLNNYENAFVYLWYHPNIGLWMGATPERLINVRENKFKTMALAGTQLYKNSTNVVWKEKEKQEQQFVTDFILENIKNNIKNIAVSEAYTVKAGSLLHIRTDISGDLIASNVIDSLIDLLHPTPAICGLPKNKATEFIFENEGYNRAYYAGYLGELNINDSTNLYVNLRCMQLNNTIASIYVGGGITADSNPKKEWEETVSKAEVMKKVL